MSSDYMNYTLAIFGIFRMRYHKLWDFEKDSEQKNRESARFKSWIDCIEKNKINSLEKAKKLALSIIDEKEFKTYPPSVFQFQDYYEKKYIFYDENTELIESLNIIFSKIYQNFSYLFDKQFDIDIYNNWYLQCDKYLSATDVLMASEPFNDYLLIQSSPPGILDFVLFCYEIKYPESHQYKKIDQEMMRLFDADENKYDFAVIYTIHQMDEIKGQNIVLIHSKYKRLFQLNYIKTLNHLDELFEQKGKFFNGFGCNEGISQLNTDKSTDDLDELSLIYG